MDNGEQVRDWLVFNAFEAQNTETYIVPNTSPYAGQLQVDLTQPENVNFMYDNKIVIPSWNNLVIRPEMDKPQVLVPGLPSSRRLWPP